MDSDHDPVVDQLRDALRSFPSGVAVVSASVGGTPYGLTVSAFTSVSLDPPMVLVCINQASRSHAYLEQASHVGISILSGDQASVAATFATAGADKFNSVDWKPSAGGAPVVVGATACISGAVVDKHVVGTHTVFYVRVEEAYGSGADPLVYFERRFVHGRALANNADA